MFCNACGTENIDGAAYCSACGAKLNSPVKASNNNLQSAFDAERATFNARTKLAEEINRIYRQVATQADNYKIVLSLKNEISKTEQALDANSRMMPSEKLGHAGLLLVLYLVTALIMGYLLEQTGDYTLSYSTAFIFLAPFLLLPSIICLISYATKSRNKAKGHDALTQQLTDNKELANKAATEIVENYNSIQDNIFDFNYADPGTVYMVYQVVSTGRADSVKEALQYLDEMKHRKVMEQIALEQLNISKQILNQTIAIHESLDFISLMSSITAARS